ncbi:membrane protein [Yersinia pekkanenii]|uniref:Membrane protein n=2 Tax=Yersinia pekkanenii TaxID=1288385 RepID=A0A0T9PJ93_9GAMM|nr:membrane protein [Yersinia pekkanenii]CRY68111.1 membrane protein [Yersinia pekkanenii]
MEKNPLDNGFTVKNIEHMRKIISRDEMKKETYSRLLQDLKKRLFFCNNQQVNICIVSMHQVLTTV